MTLLLFLLYLYTLGVICSVSYLTEESVTHNKPRWSFMLSVYVMRLINRLTYNEYRYGGNIRSAAKMWWHLFKHYPHLLHTSAIIVRAFQEEYIDPSESMVMEQVAGFIEVDQLSRGFRAQAGIY